MRFIGLAVCAVLAVPQLFITPASAQLFKLKTSYSALTANMAAYWLAKETKLFEKHGLDVDVVLIGAAPRPSGRPSAQSPHCADGSWICHNISLLPLGPELNCLPPFVSILLHFHKTEHLKFSSHGINKMTLACTDHQIGAGLCKLHYFNAVAPGRVNIQEWSSVNSSISVTENPTSLRHASSINRTTGGGNATSGEGEGSN